MMNKPKIFKFVPLILLVFACLPLKGQENTEVYDFTEMNDFVIKEITVSGIKYLNPTSIISVSGLLSGQVISIPGNEIPAAAKKLWDQGLFSDIRITYQPYVADTININIYLLERPRIASIVYNGIRSTDKEEIEGKINIKVGTQVSSYILNNTEKIIREYYVDKGFLNTTVGFVQKDNPDFPNSVILTINVDRKERVKISEITFEGNNSFEETKLRRQMKGTKMKNINFFKPSKYIGEKFSEDKYTLTTFYNDNGFKDFTIVSDSLYTISEDRVGLKIKVDEGTQYFLRDVAWVGNSVYTTEYLNAVFDVEKGSVYNPTLILDRISGAAGAEDAVNSLYLDNGYLFSNINPVESKIEGDSIDLEVRIYEGDQAYLDDIIIKGNDRTNEHVARRELYTLPGDLFSKDKIVRSIRQLGVLGHFDPEKINPVPISDPITGTVDLHYELEEKASDQFEISGGWGAGMLIGSVGVSFNNFSMRNFFDPNAWRPYPSGDGQSLSVRAQSNGRLYQSYSLSFSEPWLGGKKPNSLSASVYRSLLTNGTKKGEDGYESMDIIGASIGLGKRLTWPDDYFTLYGEAGYQRYNMNNYTSASRSFIFNDGISNLFSVTGRIQRYSVGPNVIYPRSGSSYSLSLQITPPYSLISGKDMTGLTNQEKYKWIEFHKWTFKTENYFPITRDDKMVLAAKFAFGYLGHFNNKLGPSPFENYSVGGDGLSGYTFYGQDIIKLRGYESEAVTPHEYNSSGYETPVGNVYSKITFELRYPVVLNQQASVYLLAFAESGKAWYSLREYNPFKMNRALGAGVRAYLPMFGMLGIDWGYGFDSSQYIEDHGTGNGSQFHFVIGQEF